MKNYTYIRRPSLLYRYAVFADHDDYLADSIFINHELRVYFGKEYARKDYPYRVICCKFAKGREADFEDAMEELQRKIVLYGYKDYEQFIDDVCCEIFDKERYLQKCQV